MTCAYEALRGMMDTQSRLGAKAWFSQNLLQALAGSGAKRLVIPTPDDRRIRILAEVATATEDNVPKMIWRVAKGRIIEHVSVSIAVPGMLRPSLPSQADVLLTRALAWPDDSDVFIVLLSADDPRFGQVGILATHLWRIRE